MSETPPEPSMPSGETPSCRPPVLARAWRMFIRGIALWGEVESPYVAPDQTGPLGPGRIREDDDTQAALGRFLYPEQPGAVVDLDETIVNTHFMAAYPWSAEKGWSVRH